jgi:hypothetical protein
VLSPVEARHWRTYSPFDKLRAGRLCFYVNRKDQIRQRQLQLGCRVRRRVVEPELHARLHREGAFAADLDLVRHHGAHAMVLRPAGAGKIRHAAEALDADPPALGDLLLQLPAVREGQTVLAIGAERLLQERVQDQRQRSIADAHDRPEHHGVGLASVDRSREAREPGKPDAAAFRIQQFERVLDGR